MADLAVAREGGVARVTLDRPPLNILTPALIAELGAALGALRGDPAVRVVVLAGAGRVFSAGVEVQAMRDLDPGSARALIDGLHATIRALEEVEAPVVARLHGHVLGGALELVMACDLRLAGASCRLGMPEITVGIPSVIDAVLMPGLIGWGRAAELILTGEPVEAAVAERWGLVNRVVPDSVLDAEVEAWVRRLLALPPQALRLQTALLRRWRRAGLEPSVTLSMDAFASAYASDEPRRAMQGFLDRRREGRAVRGAGG